MDQTRRAAAWVFLILLGTYAYFWHSRDWNSASRLMLTYSLVDRGTIKLDGLERNTGDIARFQGHSYTDKLPGYSLLAVPGYALAKGVLRLPDQPLNQQAITHWRADYWVTLGTSGVSTAGAGALLVVLASGLGCGSRRSALIGLTYGLATPATVYATLAYGHQSSAFALLASFGLIGQGVGRWATFRAALAGFLASFAAVVELQVGPISAILGLWLLVLACAGHWRRGALGAFAIGALVPTLILLGYNRLAFGSPWDTGYFHERLELFSQVHSQQNPLGLRRPDWSVARALLWGGHRGLLFYAPILILAVPGWTTLLVRRRWGTAVVSFLACLAVFLVNLSYPHWSGGWSTGPRLLVPLLPFAMLPVAALLAVGGRLVTTLAVVLALTGGVLMLLFQGVGARIPHDLTDPLLRIVWPLWRGDPVPPWWTGNRFDRTVVAWLWPRISQSPLQFIPLATFQAVAIGTMLWRIRNIATNEHK